MSKVIKLSSKKKRKSKKKSAGRSEEANVDKLFRDFYRELIQADKNVWNCFFEEHPLVSETNICNAFMTVDDLDNHKMRKSLKDVTIYLKQELGANRKTCDINADSFKHINEARELFKKYAFEMSDNALEITTRIEDSLKPILTGIRLFSGDNPAHDFHEVMTEYAANVSVIIDEELESLMTFIKSEEQRTADIFMADLNDLFKKIDAKNLEIEKRKNGRKDSSYGLLDF